MRNQTAADFFCRNLISLLCKDDSESLHQEEPGRGIFGVSTGGW